MKIPSWLIALGGFLIGIGAAIVAALFRKPMPTTADKIVVDGEEEKKKIAASIAADTDAQLAERFNSLAKPEEKK